MDALGLAEQLHQLTLAASERLHGLEPEHLAIDGFRYVYGRA